ncbi:putative endothelin-converting enzyme [Ixodes scapularis]
MGSRSPPAATAEQGAARPPTKSPFLARLKSIFKKKPASQAEPPPGPRYDMEPMRAIPDTTTVAPEAQNDADVWRNLPNKSQQQAEPPPPGFLYGATDQPPSGATATSVIDGGRGESLRGARSSTLRAEAGSVGSTAGPLWTERPFDETAGTSARPRTFGRADEDYASYGLWGGLYTMVEILWSLMATQGVAYSLVTLLTS